MNDKANIYHKVFQDRHETISNNLHLDPDHNDTIKLLLDAGVINEEVINMLIGTGVNSRGARIVEHIIDVNKLDVYETFLAIWRDVNVTPALEFEKLLNKHLEGYGKTRHIVVAHSRVQSAQHKFNFTANSNGYLRVDILSVSSEGLLLVGERHARQLRVYSADRCHATSIKLLDDYKVCDAVWTRHGNIVCSVYNEWRSGKVVTMSESGDVIQQTILLKPSYLGVSTDGVIYLISNDKCVYQSTDDGVTWSHVFTVPGHGKKCWQVIKVSTNSNTDVLWTVEEVFEEDWYLRVYTVDKQRAVGDNCVLSSSEDLPNDSRLAYDGYSSVFITDYNKRAVDVWSVSGQYDRQLVSPQQLETKPCCVTVDTQHRVLYVCYENGNVGGFELKYGLV